MDWPHVALAFFAGAGLSAALIGQQARTIMAQTEALRRELRHGAAVTAILFDMLAATMRLSGDEAARLREAFLAFVQNRDDAHARATLERTGIPPAWLDEIARVLPGAADQGTPHH